MGEVAHIYRCLVHRFPMEELETGELIVDKGLKGCIHGRPGTKRQVLLMQAETLETLSLVPGAVKENFTTRGLDLCRISPGMLLKIGEGILEATIPCEPCYRMDEIRQGLRAELKGRRGWLFRVVQGGLIRRGDKIEVLSEASTQAAD